MGSFKGFSLVDLIVALALMIIIIAIGVPSLAQMLDLARAESNIRKLQQTLMLARNNAISLGRRVTVCALEDNQCSNNWQKGVSVFTDSGDLNKLDGIDKLIYTTGQFDPKDIIKYNRTSIRFQPDGLASGTNGTLKYCPSSALSPYSKAVIINQSGRIRFSKEATINCT